jgi:hypothetical protein
MAKDEISICHETILAIGARGHVASDWNFADLTCTLEESKERGVETRDTRSRETILAIEARGHMASDWNFTDLHIGGVKGI